jgi:epoxyqueuosine reductase QueG
MKEKIRTKAIELGADVCGFAAVERFDSSPTGFHPKDLYKNCESAIVFAVALPKGLYDVDPRLIYEHFNDLTCSQVDQISFHLANYLEVEYNAIGVPIPCDGPYEYWNTDKKEGKGLLSMKHAAINAGLGNMGKNTLFLNSKFGNRLVIGTVLTNLELVSDEYSKSICLEPCNLCIMNCPVSAIHNNHVDQKLCREHTYSSNDRGFSTVECNTCRTICPMRFGEK